MWKLVQRVVIHPRDSQEEAPFAELRYPVLRTSEQDVQGGDAAARHRFEETFGQIAEVFAESQEKNMSLEIRASTTMEEILSAHPSAKLGLFRRYHIGGCTACGYQPTDTLEQVIMGDHNISDPLEAVIACILESRQVEAGLQILPTAVAAALKPKQETRLVDVSSPQVEAALERGESWPLIDVRSPEEWVNGHIPGA